MSLLTRIYMLFANISVFVYGNERIKNDASYTISMLSDRSSLTTSTGSGFEEI